MGNIAVGTATRSSIYVDCEPVVEKSVIDKLIELKNKESQRICMIAYSIIDAIGLYLGRALLPKFRNALESVSDVHNFVNWIKQPYTWSNPVTASVINPSELLASLQPILEKKLSISDKEAETLAKQMIERQLNLMNEKNVAYRNVNDFKKALQANLKGASVDLSDLQVKIHSSSLISRISALAFDVTDFLSVPFYLMYWNVDVKGFVQRGIEATGLGQYAESLGQTRVFQAVSKYSLLDTIWSLCCVGFAADLIKATRELINSKSTIIQKENAKHSAILALAELVRSGANLIKADQTVLIFITIVSKSIGIVNFFYKPSPRVFDNTVDKNKS